MGYRKLGRLSGHRQAMLRNALISFFRYERIQTTEAKAKELRRLAEGLVTLAKRGDLHARRQAARLLPDKEVLKKLFDTVGPRYKERAGGYTRIYKLGPRQGDAAPMAILELA
ncbi:MAG: large subunit ribosomal protein [Bacillota bacterium]|jgi:large subunit ribosomal protein L17|nr:large subunit ribosomal protein [Bacillota bacterium]